MRLNTIKFMTIFGLFYALAAQAGPVMVPNPAGPQLEEDLREYREGEDDTDNEIVSSGVSNPEDVGEDDDEAGWNDDESIESLVVKAAAKKKKKKKCECSSGCGMNQAGLKEKIKKYVAAAKKKGIRPVSCIRTQACQNRLRSCYENKCGQSGRAAKKSAHADGKACDFSKKDGSNLNPLRKQHGINRLVHGKEGGGLHDYQ